MNPAQFHPPVPEGSPVTQSTLDTILQRHFNSVKQFAGRIIDDVAHPLHSDLISAKSSRPMRRSFRHVSCCTSAFQASSDLDCSAAELAFGATISLPGEMITSTIHGAVEDSVNLLDRFRQFVRILSPVPPILPLSESYLEKDLASCSCVCLRCGRVCWPLVRRFLPGCCSGAEDPRIQRGTRKEVVSVGRPKVAVPNERRGPLPLAPPSSSLAIPPSRIFTLPPYPLP
ncbi:hypothetical protein SprV_0200915100 [Sparganum proliferum]